MSRISSKALRVMIVTSTLSALGANCPLEFITIGDVCELNPGVCDPEGEDGASGGNDCFRDAGKKCATDYQAMENLVIIEHGPGVCENTGTEPGPSLESYTISMPASAFPGETVTFAIDWNRCSDCNPNAVIYSSLIGDWAPGDPLFVSNGYFTSCSETARDTVVFSAPNEPGTYRLRWILCYAFQAIDEFCGEHARGNSSNPGTCPYIEVSLRVCREL